MRKNAVEAARLRDQGLTYKQIGERIGLAMSTVGELIADPDGLKVRERKARYGGTCECGNPTYGGDGRAKAAKRCGKCRPRAAHGTRSRYVGGCRCDDCCVANTVAVRQRRHSGNPPPQHGTNSGYQNYGCRCEECRQAHNEYQRSEQHSQYVRRWEESVRGTRPPRHGTHYIYKTYGCRCDECRAAAAEYSRAKYERRKAAGKT